jgi:hypothetical protein
MGDGFFRKGCKQDGGAIMVYAQPWKPRTSLAVMPVRPGLALIGADAQIPFTPGKAKVDRLVMGLILPYWDNIRP